MLHFAYGANMSRAIMQRHAHDAQPLGRAELVGHRFHITGDGYASIEPAPAHSVHGVIWRITPRDRVRLDAWENIGAGLYGAQTLSVRQAGRIVRALVYVARPSGEGFPKSGYMEPILDAARDWNLPLPYISNLEDWSRKQSRGSGSRKLDKLATAIGRRHLTVSRHAKFYGQVQGVGFRAFVERQALHAGLAGWVRNRRDGTVEAVFLGEAAAVDTVIAVCRRGPVTARVNAVDIREAGAEERGLGTKVDFIVLPTV